MAGTRAAAAVCAFADRFGQPDSRLRAYASTAAIARWRVRAEEEDFPDASAGPRVCREICAPREGARSEGMTASEPGVTAGAALTAGVGAEVVAAVVRLETSGIDSAAAVGCGATGATIAGARAVGLI